MSIKKQYIKSSGLFKCTFRLPKEAVPKANKVSLVGDFNAWQLDALEMKKLKSGEFKAELSLEPGKSYEFRYYVDDQAWLNDWDADAYIPKPDFAAENSLVAL